MKAINKPKPARGFAGALQQFDLQKAVHNSKLSANSTTTVICDTIRERVSRTPKPDNF